MTMPSVSLMAPPDTSAAASPRITRLCGDSNAVYGV